MTTVFPTSNLPTASQPWAREVQKQLVNLIASDNSERINNTARDNQLNSSIIALGGVVSGVTNALTEIGLLQDTVLVDGEPTKINGANIKVGTLSASSITTGELSATRISGGTLNASLMTVTNLSASSITTGTMSADRISGGSISGNLITGGTITGTVIQSQSSGQRIVVESNRLAIYGQSNIFAGQLYGQDDGTNPFLYLSGGGTGLYMNLGGIVMQGPVVFGDGISGAITTTNGNVRALGVTGTSFVQSENYAGGGTTGASINNNGTIVRTGSTRRIKQDIEDLSVSYADLLSLIPKRFRLKEEAIEDENARYYAGFIAEEIDQTSLKDFVAYERLKDGTIAPSGVYYGELTAALLEAIKHQDQLIKSLTDRIETLEKGA